MRHYLDTSAAAKLIVEEQESLALATHLNDLPDDSELVSSALLETELRRLAVREGLAQTAVTDVVDRVSLVEPDRSMFHQAGLLPGRHLRSLDALHLMTALRLNCEEILAYDARMSDAARSIGLAVTAPA